MEHGPYDAESLRRFLPGMTDKSAIASSGSLAMQTTPIVRLPTNGREMNQYLVKQVLDLGVYGVMFPMINCTKKHSICGMRIAQRQLERQTLPPGWRERRATPSGVGDCLW